MNKDAGFKYQRAFWTFMAILLTFLLVADLLVVSNQRKHLLNEVQENLHHEIDLIATFMREPLLMHDYAKVEEFLMNWAKERDDVVEVRAVMPNNFVLVDYKSRTQLRYDYVAEKQVQYGGRDLIKLRVGKDLSSAEGILNRLQWQLAGFSIVLAFLFGTLLWHSFRTLALRPLEREIALRSQAEEKLQKAKDQLEIKVRERTAELKERELRLKTIIETEPECVKILAPDGTLITMNPAGLAMIEADSLEEVKGSSILSLVDPKDRDAFRKLNDAVMQGGKGNIEFALTGLKGARRWLDTHVVPLRNERNEIVEILGVTRDITERKKSETALRLSEEKFSKAFRSSPAFVSISTVQDGRFIEVNDAFLEASGYSREEMLGRSSLELGIWADTTDRGQMVSQLKEHGAVYSKESKFRMKRGEIINILYSAELIEIEKEQCIIAVILDITERKKLEYQLLQAQKMEAVGQLAGGIAHDFNNIITAIFSYGYLLQGRLKSDEISFDYINKILSLSDRAAQITRGLLTFSRKQHFEVIPVNLNDVISNIKKLLVNFIAEDIELTTNLSEQEIIILADRHQLEQVVLNLATNARDAMPGGGKLTIETGLTEISQGFINAHGFGMPGSYALLTITDTGMGMDAETKQKIFEPFFTTKEVGKGTGLGLSVVYGIIKQHGGFINVYSEPGSGSAFRIYLPEIKAPVRMKEENEPLKKIGKSATILLAEDEQAVRVSVREILEEYGYNVIEAVDGQDAVEKFMQYKDKIGLILLDVVMPKMNGKEAYEVIRRLSPEIKAIFTSGYTADVVLQKKVFEEDVIFISKPIIPDRLLSKIREVIENEL